MNSSARQIRPADEGVIGTSGDGRAVIRFERRLDHSADRVWRAVTEPDEMQKWLAYRAHVDLRLGGSHDLWLGGNDSEAPVQHGTITELDVGSVIEVDYDDGSTLRWVVHPDGAGSRLVFTDARPRGERAQNSVLAGWHIRVDQLPRALDEVAMDWEGLDRDRDTNGYIRPIVDIYWHYRNRDAQLRQGADTN